MKMKRTTEPQHSLRNPYGHFRARQDISKFEGYFERRGDVAVLRQFLNGTATWVQNNFSSIELEVHQAASLGRAARERNQTLDKETLRAQFPRLAILATDDDLHEVLKGDPSPKDVTAGMLSRVLHREESSIKRWGQGKK